MDVAAGNAGLNRRHARAAEVNRAGIRAAETWRPVLDGDGSRPRRFR